MENVTEAISNASKAEIELYLKEIMKRYEVLFPDWEINAISLHKQEDKNKQIEQIIRLLESLRDVQP